MEPSDDSYFTAPPPMKSKPSPGDVDGASALCSHHLQDCNLKFYQQFVMGSSLSPVSLDFWGSEDPRFHEPGNPLWEPGACTKSDWRDGLTRERFEEFYAWCLVSDSLVKRENQCQDCRACRKAKKKQKKKKKKAVDVLAKYGYDEASILANGDGQPTPHNALQDCAAIVHEKPHNSTSSPTPTPTPTPLNTPQTEAPAKGAPPPLTTNLGPCPLTEGGVQKGEGEATCTKEPDCPCRSCHCLRELDDIDAEEGESSVDPVKPRGTEVNKVRKVNLEEAMKRPQTIEWSKTRKVSPEESVKKPTSQLSWASEVRVQKLSEQEAARKPTNPPAWASEVTRVIVLPPLLSLEEKKRLFGWTALLSEESQIETRAEAVILPAHRGGGGDRIAYFDLEFSRHCVTKATGVWVSLLYVVSLVFFPLSFR